jgi:nuclear pore complex protein Nup133
LYNYYIKRGEFFALINDNYEHRNYLTEFLRSRKEFSRLAWINDIIPEKNFDRAAKTLLDLGLHRERDLWCKKVDLSIGKLARLSGRQYSETNGLIIPDGAQVDLEGAEKALELIRIQEKIFSHVYPAISAAIDEKAELQLALEVYGNERLRRKDALSGLLHEKMSWLIEHKAMDALDIIDLLTLMADNKRSDMHGTIDGQEFFLALQALKAGPSDKDVQSLTEKMIWRRCMLRDDWEEINNTDLKDDEQVSRNLERTALFSTLRACFKNGKFSALDSP